MLVIPLNPHIGYDKAAKIAAKKAFAEHYMLKEERSRYCRRLFNASRSRSIDRSFDPRMPSL